MTEPIMGRVDVLFELLRRANLDNPDAVRRFIPSLDPDTETRPLADQIADAILSERPDLYEAFLSIKAQASLKDPYSQAISGEHGPTLLGEFLSRWVIFERFIRRLARIQDMPVQAVPTSNMMKSLLRDQPIPLKLLEHLRYIRNNLVHGHRQPSAEILRSSIDEFDSVLEALEQNNDPIIQEALVWARSNEEDRPPSFYPRRSEITP
jgi:hypothetical protein